MDAATPLPQRREQEKKTVFVFDQVKVIPAYQRGRLVVVSRLPLANRPVGSRQKSTLDSGGQHQVALLARFLPKKHGPGARLVLAAGISVDFCREPTGRFASGRRDTTTSRRVGKRDYFDLIENEDSFLFLLGDVAGKESPRPC